MLAAGIILVILSGSWRDRALAPGPLTASHAQILDRVMDESRCAACHVAGEEGVAGWTVSLVAAHANRPSQSQRCMECHRTTISVEHALAAHNLPAAELQRITTARAAEAPRTSPGWMNAAFSPGGQLACSICHREHHGPDFDLAAMDNDACQSCHQQQYESFATDHPDFGSWPYERRSRIAFNHASHASQHFAEKNQSFDCRSCHREDRAHTVQLTDSYEAACASCHDERIATSVAHGVPMLVVPILDVDALRAAGHDIGKWPEQATGDFDGRLPAPMKLLLAADPAAAEAMHKLGDDFEFADVDPDDPQQLAACAVLANAIPRLFADLSAAGSREVRTRLEAALDHAIPNAEGNALVAGLSTDTIRGAAAWMTGPVAETTPSPVPVRDREREFETASSGHPRLDRQHPGLGIQHQIPPSTSLPTQTLNGIANLSYAPAGEWFLDEVTLSVRYRPAGHADPVLTSWLDLLASAPAGTRLPLIGAALKELSHPTAAGLCATCHSIEQTSSQRLAINWCAYDGEGTTRSFTKFSHGPHLVLPQLADCTACHSIDTRASDVNAYAGSDPHRFTSDFASISRRQCAQCHTATAVGDKCQTCHNYHVNDIELFRATTRFTSRSVATNMSETVSATR
jgi:hypothetical protein